MSEIIIDVREKDEYQAERIPNSIHAPLSEFRHIAPGILNSVKDKKIIFMCRSGKRAAIALQEAQNLGFNDIHSYRVFDGGIIAWKQQGKPIASGTGFHLPIMRQVQMIAGLLTAVGSALAYFYSIEWIALSGFVGVGLMVAGSTGFCLMAELLAKAPWNKGKAISNQCST